MENKDTREKTAEENFCKLYSDFHGEKIDSLKQITRTTFNGEDLLDFCEEYKNLCFQEAIKSIEELDMTGNVYSLKKQAIQILKEEING